MHIIPSLSLVQQHIGSQTPDSWCESVNYAGFNMRTNMLTRGVCELSVFAEQDMPEIPGECAREALPDGSPQLPDSRGACCYSLSLSLPVGQHGSIHMLLCATYCWSTVLEQPARLAHASLIEFVVLSH